MDMHLQDPLAEAERLYGEYARLSELGQLGMVAEEKNEGAIIASVSPVLIKGFANGIVG